MWQNQKTLSCSERERNRKSPELWENQCWWDTTDQHLWSILLWGKHPAELLQGFVQPLAAEAGMAPESTASQPQHSKVWEQPAGNKARHSRDISGQKTWC